MSLIRSNILTMVTALGIGLFFGALFFGRSDQSLTADAHVHEPGEKSIWTCSMHPQVRQEEPGKCPFCGMDLIPVNEAGEEGPAILKMSKAALQLANVQTSIIQRSATKNTLLLNGKVKVDERQVHTQATHFEGRIEKLYKNFTGENIKKGEKIASLYSPKLVAAQEELIEAKKLERSNPSLLEAARKKLRYWKLSDVQIRAIENAQEPIRNFDLLADYSGVITKKLVNVGDHLHEGEGLFETTNFQNLWIIFEVYEQDVSKVKLGNTLTFTTPATPGKIHQAKIAFISPILHAQNRVVEVRADFDNSQQSLKPDMFVTGNLQISSDTRLLKVPRSAVLWTGKRSIVYKKITDAEVPSFQLTEILLGEEMNGYYLVEEGLNEGDEIVTNGTFTVDAEAQLKGKNSMMNPIATVSNNDKTTFEEIRLPVFKNYQNQVTPLFKDQLKALSQHYMKLKDAMVKGDPSNISQQSLEVANALEKVDMTLTQEEAHAHWMELYHPINESIRLIRASNDREEQRLVFINLSNAMINALKSFGSTYENPLYIQFCPMANDNKGALWLSLEEDIINPYFGDAMLHCGNVEEVLTNYE